LLLSRIASASHDHTCQTRQRGANGLSSLRMICNGFHSAGPTNDGLDTPTEVEPVGDTIWITERGAGKAVSIAMPK
jgi:hypothetical protein